MQKAKNETNYIYIFYINKIQLPNNNNRPIYLQIYKKNLNLNTI